MYLCITLSPSLRIHLSSSIQIKKWWRSLYILFILKLLSIVVARTSSPKFTHFWRLSCSLTRLSSMLSLEAIYFCADCLDFYPIDFLFLLYWVYLTLPASNYFGWGYWESWLFLFLAIVFPRDAEFVSLAFIWAIRKLTVNQIIKTSYLIRIIFIQSMGLNWIFARFSF